MSADELKYMSEIKEHLNTLSIEQRKQGYRLNAISKELMLTKNTLIGTGEYGSVGLVAQVKELTLYKEKDQRLKYKVAGGTVVLGALWIVIKEIIPVFLK